MSQFEHLELPKTSIELPRRSRGGSSGGSSRSDRSSHGQQLLTQISGLTQRFEQKKSRFHLNPKLIFKMKLSPDRELAGKLSSPTKLDEKLSPLGVVLLAQEPKENKAIVVFTSDRELTQLRSRLESYSSADGPQYGELDAIEALVPLEPADRIGRLLKLEPVESSETAALVGHLLCT